MSAGKPTLVRDGLPAVIAESSGLTRATWSYAAESRLEKPVRASFLTTLNRKLAKRSVVIADGLNYIKGYRYQMNCAAKEAGVRYCTVRPLQQC